MEGNKRLIIGQFRNPEIEFLKNTNWIFTEKVDGTNIRVEWDGHKVVFKGRTDNAQIPNHLLLRLEELFGGSINEQLFEQQFGNKTVTMYGEGFGEKIQKGGGLYGKVDFILFDIQINGVFLHKIDVAEIAKSFNLRIVPTVLEGSIDDGVRFIQGKPQSVISEQTREMEGIIGVPRIELCDRFGKRIIVKIKCEDFNF